MSYIQDSLSKGENIVKVFKLHWLTLIVPKIYILLALLAIPLPSWLIEAGIASQDNSGAFIVLWLLMPVFLIKGAWDLIVLKFIENGVTNKRVITKKGVISRKTDEMKISSIETVEINQGILGRIFGFGDVKVTGAGISDVLIKGIENPISVKREIESAA